MKKRLIGIALLLLSATWQVGAAGNQLNIYTWSGYISDAVVKKFEQETGIQVNISTYASNEILYAKLKSNPESSYDVIVPSNYMVERMIKNGLIQKIDKTKLTNFGNVDSAFLRKQHDLDNDYSIPYLWNATGVVVNEKYHPRLKINKWTELWQPQYIDQLLILDDAREILSMALITLGYPANSQDQKQIQQAYEQLRLLKPNIKLFNTEAPRSIYIDEDITIGMSWNGDALLAKRENPNLKFFYPQDGFVISLDCLAISSGAKNIINAHKFIDFVLRAEIAKEITVDSGFSTANSAAKQLLPKDIRNDLTAYPSAEIMRHAHFQTDVGAAAAIYEKYFEQLKLK